jgi:hypothetical protein
MQRFTKLTLGASSSVLALLATMTSSPALAQAPLPVGGTVASGQAQIGARGRHPIDQPVERQGHHQLAKLRCRRRAWRDLQPA